MNQEVQALADEIKRTAVHYASSAAVGEPTFDIAVGIKKLIDRLAAMVQPPATQLSTECHWSQDSEDGDTWAAQCGRYFTINDGSPSDNEMRFCCFCGKPLVEIRFEDEHE